MYVASKLCGFNATIIIFVFVIVIVINAGARIDHAHHENMAHRAIQETVAFEETVKEAMSLTNSQETLVVVTADHSHVMTLGGYGSWNENVLGG